MKKKNMKISLKLRKILKIDKYFWLRFGLFLLILGVVSHIFIIFMIDNIFPDDMGLGGLILMWPMAFLLLFTWSCLVLNVEGIGCIIPSIITTFLIGALIGFIIQKIKKNKRFI